MTSPGWQIERDPSGRWSATRPGWGTLYGRTSEDLRNRIYTYAADTRGHDQEGDAQ